MAVGFRGIRSTRGRYENFRVTWNFSGFDVSYSADTITSDCSIGHPARQSYDIAFDVRRSRLAVKQISNQSVPKLVFKSEF